MTNHLLYFAIVTILSCGQSSNKLETYDQFRTQQIEKRDSLFILHTVKEWSKNNWYTFEDYSQMYKMTNQEVDYFFGGIFYSPDKKKLIVWLGQRKPNASTIEKYNEKAEGNKLCPNGKDIVYSMTALIGNRDNINQAWKLYPFNQQQATCYDKKDEVINVLGQYYFDQMKKHKMYRMVQSGKMKGHKDLEPYGYNLQDKEFWDKCWLFQKDTVGSYGLYPFQIKGYDYKGDVCTQKCAEPYNPPQIIYPKKILELYK
jgi:hypothetical protein